MHERDHRVVQRRRYAGQPALRRHPAVEHVDLGAPPGQHVLKHRRLVVVGDLDRLLDQGGEVRGRRDAERGADRQRLGHQRVHQGPQSGVGADRPHRQPRQRREGRGRGVEDRPCPTAGRARRPARGGSPARVSSAASADLVAIEAGRGSNGPSQVSPGRVVPHDAGPDHGAGRQDRPADHPRHQLGEDLLVAQPVLHAGDRGVGEHLGAGGRPPPWCARPWSPRSRGRSAVRRPPRSARAPGP